MASGGSQVAGQAAAPTGPTTYYFAYGSNLHLAQMKRRCPESKYIGRARLANYRWQINERGYANVVAAGGHWVDGLVYEINPVDEAKLDINEGVSKNAYTKHRIPVRLYRGPSSLYRRPTSWIVDRGGPAKITGQTQKLSKKPSHWVQEVLVYISTSYVQDSSPKPEYVNRINSGIEDARALGMDEDYITNCIRPFVQAPQAKAHKPLPVPVPERTKTPFRGQKRNASPRTAEPSPPRRGKPAGGGQTNKPTSQQQASATTRVAAEASTTRRATPRGAAPPLPPRPEARYPGTYPIIVQEFRLISGPTWAQ